MAANFHWVTTFALTAQSITSGGVVRRHSASATWAVLPIDAFLAARVSFSEVFCLRRIKPGAHPCPDRQRPASGR